MPKLKESQESLKGWTAIAKFLSQPVSTAQRWANEECLSLALVGTWLHHPLSWSVGREAGAKATVHIPAANTVERNYLNGSGIRNLCDSMCGTGGSERLKERNINEVKVSFYEPSVNDRIRVAVRYENAWRPIFWLMVRKDGSIYLGPRYTNVSVLRKGTKEISGSRVSVKYEEGQDITDPELRKSPKVSFHASGRINVVGDRLLRDSLRTIVEQQELCRALFQHPSHYAGISKIEDRDICLDYPLDETQPLQGILFVAPSNNAKLVRIPSANQQINLMLPFSGFTDVPDLLLQFLLGHGPVGPWPPYAYLMFGTLSGRI